MNAHSPTGNKGLWPCSQARGTASLRRTGEEAITGPSSLCYPRSTSRLHGYYHSVTHQKGMTESYEVKGCVRKIEQRRSRRSVLPHLRDFESFDVEFSPAGRVIRTIHYTISGSVRGAERFTYNKAGALTGKLFFDAAGVQTSGTEYEYDVEGRQVGWVSKEASGAATRRCVQTYLGELLSSTAVFQENGPPVWEKVFEYAGETVQKSLAKYYAPNGDLNEEWISHYDSNGRVELTFGLTAEGKPLGDGKYRFAYDAEGRLIKTLSLNEWTNDNVPESVTVFEYTADEVGNWIERLKHFRFKSDTAWTTQITTRKISYYPNPY